MPNMRIPVWELDSFIKNEWTAESYYTKEQRLRRNKETVGIIPSPMKTNPFSPTYAVDASMWFTTANAVRNITEEGW